MKTIVTCVNSSLIRTFKFICVISSKFVYPGLHKYPIEKVKWNYHRRTWRSWCKPVSADTTIGELCIQKGARVQLIPRCTIQLENHIQLLSSQLGVDKMFKLVQEVVFGGKCPLRKKNGQISWVWTYLLTCLPSANLVQVLLFDNSMC